MFYKLESEGYLSSGLYLVGPDYTLIEGEHLDYTYPIDGWVWMDTYAEALEYFGIGK